MVVRFFNAGVAAALLSLPLGAQVFRNGVPAGQVVIIQGLLTGGKTRWSTYQNGVFSRDAYMSESFQVPGRKTLVIVEADLTAAGDTRKLVSMDLALARGRFPLAHVSFANPGAASPFTATRTFALGLVVPARSASGQEGLMNLAVHDPQPAATYEVLLHGYYTEP